MCLRAAKFNRPPHVYPIKSGSTAFYSYSRGILRLKITSLRPSAAAVALLTAVVFGAATTAQEPQTTPAPQTPPAAQTPATPEGGPDHHIHTFPAPTNLQVLPKDLTGQQVHQIMDGWASALGTHCSTCHAPNPNEPPSANGHVRLDYALDIKPEKKTARLMYTMVQDIKTNYMSKIDNVGIEVSCGTCHRGHLSPPPFIPPPEHHMDMAPPPGGAAPAGEPPAAPPAN